MSASDDTPKVEETPAASAAEESKKDEKSAAAAAAETVAKPDEGEKDKVSDEEKGPKSETEDKQAKGETSAEEPAKPDDGPPIVLVTGALGYIASNVIHQLAQQGKYRVRGTLRSAKADNRLKALKQLVSKAQHPPEFVEADLLNENACNSAVRGCTYVLHVATAGPPKTPKREEDAIRHAAEGVKNVFKACVAAGTVKRVVVTSSIAAVSNGLNPVESGKVHTEDDWSEEEHCATYDKGKLRAERAALEFVKEAEESKKFELVVLCPSCVIGPVVIPNKMNPTLAMFEQILAKGAGFSDQFYPLVDVRDVATAHLVAMERPDCAGHRCIVANKTIHMKDIVSAVADEFNSQGFKINNKPAKVSKLFGKKGGSVKPAQAKEMLYSTDRMKAELGVEARDLAASILDTCYALVDSGLVKKKKGYLGHPSSRPPKEEPKPKEEAKPKKDPKSKEAKAKEGDTKAADTAGQAGSEESSATASKSDGEKNADAGGTAEPKVEQPKPEESATKDEEPKKPTSEPPAETSTQQESAKQPTPEPAKEPTPEPAKEPTSEPAKEPTPEPAKEPTPEPVKEPTPEPAKEPEPEPPTEETTKQEEPTPEPAEEPTPEPAKEPTPEPAKEPTPEPAKEPTPELAKEPTPEPAKEPTPEPAKEPTPEPAKEPTPEPAKEPTPEPAKEPTPE